MLIDTWNGKIEEYYYINQMPTIAEIEQSGFDKVNAYRATQGLPALVRNTFIDTQCRIHSQNMANGSVPFGHQGFSTRVINTGIRYTSAAENVAYNQGYADSAKVAVDGWLKSAGHLANIKGNFNLAGMGVAVNPQGAWYFTQIFIKQA